jgi:hypothetical protein
MPEIIDRRISCNGGEVSPWTDPRIDLEKYRSSARRLENQRPNVYGGSFRRPGSIYLGPAMFSETRSRLVEFEFSVTTTLVLEFAALKLRFWTTGATPGLVGGATPYERTTPWSAVEIFELQFAQLNDLVVITHPAHRPRVLRRLANDNWTLDPLEAEWPATLDPNITATTLALSAVTGSAVTVTASAANTFQAGHIGSTWVLAHRRNDPSVQLALSSAVNAASAALFVLGEWSCTVAVNVGGTWERNAVVQRSYDKVTWETLRSVSSSGVASGSVTGTELEPAWLRVLIVSGSGTPPTGSFQLEAFDPDHYSLLKITAVAGGGGSATASVLFEASSTAATLRWSEPAWSGVRGYPRAVTFHEGRLMFGGTSYRPQTVWGSVIDDFFNFRLGSEEDLGLAFSLASDAANGVQWLVSQEALVIGTTGSEWALGSRNSERVLSGSTASAKRNTNYGSAYIQARAVNDATLFVQRSGRKVREFVYSFEKDGFSAPDLTMLAEHITDGGILQMAVAKNPETVVWFVTGAGELIGLTYERGQNVAGWFRYTTAGSYESVAVVSGAGEEDEIWVSVLREIDGAEVRFIERFQPDIIRELKTSGQAAAAYSDAAVRYIGTPASTMGGLDHLEGESVAILADGAPLPEQVVEGGEITLPFAAGTIIAGLPYVSEYEPTYLETGEPGSLSKVAVKRIHRATIELWKSLGMEVSGDDGETWSQIEFRGPADFMDAAPPLFTGILEERVSGSSVRQASIRIRQTQPLPLNIMSVHVRYELNTV